MNESRSWRYESWKDSNKTEDHNAYLKERIAADPDRNPFSNDKEKDRNKHIDRDHKQSTHENRNGNTSIHLANHGMNINRVHKNKIQILD